MEMSEAFGAGAAAAGAHSRCDLGHPRETSTPTLQNSKALLSICTLLASPLIPMARTLGPWASLSSVVTGPRKRRPSIRTVLADDFEDRAFHVAIGRKEERARIEAAPCALNRHAGPDSEPARLTELNRYAGRDEDRAGEVSLLAERGLQLLGVGHRLKSSSGTGLAARPARSAAFGRRGCRAPRRALR